MNTQEQAPQRRNAPKTKEKILAAAQQAFSERGFAQVGIRDIAKMAGVTSPLVLRYFGSKAGLFEAALIDSMRVKGLFSAGREQFGEHLTHLLRDVNLDTTASSMVSRSTSDPDAQAIATRAIVNHVIEPLAEWLGPPDGDVRALQIVIVGLGYAQCKQLFPMLSTKTGVDSALDRWYAETLQAISDQSETSRTVGAIKLVAPKAS